MVGRICRFGRGIRGVQVSRRDLLFGTPGISVHGTDSPANASTTASATSPADQPENHQHQRLKYAVSLPPGTGCGTQK